MDKDIEYSDIESIEFVGEVDTYDIHNFDDNCLDGEGNFIADDIIVHNSIPDVIKNRDDKSKKWLVELEETHKDLPKILGNSYGHMIFQEDLATIWQVLADFSAVDAQEARKAVAKKWAEKLKPIEKKWLDGAKETIGEEKAKEYWQKMVTFGRYAFNKCLSKDTVLTDMLSQKSQTVEEWCLQGEQFQLPSYNDGTVEPDTCVKVYYSGEREVFKVEFDDGRHECVTLGHQFMCDDGKYYTVKEIYAKGLSVISTATG